VVQGKTAQAQRASANAKEMLPKTMDEAARLQIEIAHSYVSGIASLSGSSGNDSRTTLADATKALEATRQRAGHLGYLGLELEARLRAGQLDMRAGKASSGRLQLDQLQKDAQSKGFLLTARQAKAALSGN